MAVDQATATTTGFGFLWQSAGSGRTGKRGAQKAMPSWACWSTSRVQRRFRCLAYHRGFAESVALRSVILWMRVNFEDRIVAFSVSEPGVPQKFGCDSSPGSSSACAVGRLAWGTRSRDRKVGTQLLLWSRGCVRRLR